ncbi:MAG: cytochrome d ubiquinol oxidase subunit II [Desulfovibrio sp.]
MLETIWFVIWGVLWMGYFILDGFDLGMGMLMPVLAKTDTEKRIIYNAAGPFWDGNEVWLIAAGGVTFAAFPLAYAVMFQGLYTALMLLLFALIVRGVSFEFRSKVEDPRWRKMWDYCQIGGSFLPALLLGVAFANIFQGLPINEQHINEAGLLDLLNPYGLAGGILFILMFAMHGAIWLGIKARGPLQERAGAFASKLWGGLLVYTVAFLGFTFVQTNLFNNYFKWPVLFIIPAIAVVGLLLMHCYIASAQWWKAWFSSAAYIGGVTMFGVAGLFPALLPSSLNPAWSITATDAAVKAASSPLTLKIMLGAVLLFLPFVLGYQYWTYKTFSFPVDENDLEY